MYFCVINKCSSEKKQRRLKTNISHQFDIPDISNIGNSSVNNKKRIQFRNGAERIFTSLYSPANKYNNQESRSRSKSSKYRSIKPKVYDHLSPNTHKTLKTQKSLPSFTPQL